MTNCDAGKNDQEKLCLFQLNCEKKLLQSTRPVAVPLVGAAAVAVVGYGVVRLLRRPHKRKGSDETAARNKEQQSTGRPCVDQARPWSYLSFEEDKRCRRARIRIQKLESDRKLHKDNRKQPELKKSGTRMNKGITEIWTVSLIVTEPKRLRNLQEYLKQNYALENLSFYQYFVLQFVTSFPFLVVLVVAT